MNYTLDGRIVLKVVRLIHVTTCHVEISNKWNGLTLKHGKLSLRCKEERGSGTVGGKVRNQDT